MNIHGSCLTKLFIINYRVFLADIRAWIFPPLCIDKPLWPSTSIISQLAFIAPGYYCENRNSGDSCNICGRQIATEDHESPPNTAAEYCMESLEAVWRSELTSPKENKIDNCRQLLIDYHKAPEKAEGMFSEIAKFFKNTAGIS